MSDDLLQLLTAAIDGALTPAEAQRLKRVLAESAEARAVYAKLKADSERLRTLPRVKPPADLHKRVMARVATATPPVRRTKSQPQPQEPDGRPSEPAVPAARPFAAQNRTWVPFAVAASVMVGITASSFLFFANQNSRGKGTRPAETESAKWLPADSAPRPSAPVPHERPGGHDRGPIVVRPDVPPDRPPAVPDTVAVAPEPRPVRSDLIGSPIGPITKFDLVDVRVPFLKAVSEFDREDTQQQLAEEFTRDPAFRIDLFARDSARGVEAFQSAAKAAGLTLHADAATLDRLKKRQGNQANAVVIYTEALTAAELADLFGKLTAEDAKYSPRVFDLLHAVPASRADSDELRALFGVDPGLFKRPAPVGEKGEKPDPSKPISAGTVDQIVKTVAGQGKPAEKHAVLLTWSPPTARTAPAASAELKQFLAKRGPRQPNVVPVVIVIRPGNG